MGMETMYDHVSLFMVNQTIILGLYFLRILWLRFKAFIILSYILGIRIVYGLKKTSKVVIEFLLRT